MAWIRQYDPNSKGERLWAATIYYGNNKRLTRSHINYKIIQSWANAQEAAIDRGDWIHPDLGNNTVQDIWNLYGEGRRLEMASRKRDASHWANWVLPKWGGVRIGSILKPDVNKWIVELESRTGARGEPNAKVGGWTIIASLALLRSLLEIAVDARMIHFNPARGVKAPPPPKHIDRILTDDECDRLLANFYSRFPGRAEAGLFCEVLAYCGPRYEELAALRRTPEALDMRNHILNLRPVMEKDGTIREYGKTAASTRPVPVDDDLWPALRDHILTVTPGELVFTTAQGGKLLYDNWLKRVWKKGLLTERKMTEAEIEEWKAARVAEGLRPWRAKWIVEAPVVDDPQPTPHDLRHLYGTRLAEANITPHERMALMGHDDERAGRRYVNPRDERFERAKQAMKRVRRSST
jgi:integrase